MEIYLKIIKKTKSIPEEEFEIGFTERLFGKEKNICYEFVKDKILNFLKRNFILIVIIYIFY